MNTPLTCAQVQPQLPYALGDNLDADRRAAIEAHLATCAACRGELALWRMLPSVLAEQRGDRAVGRSTRESWARLEPLLATATPDDTSLSETPEWSDAPYPLTTPRPGVPPRHTPKANSFIAVLAAVLIVAVSGALFSYLHGMHSTLATPGGVAPVQLGYHPTHLISVNELLPNTIFYDVQMLSPDDGWAVGGTNVIIGGSVSTYNTAIYHYQHGRWSASPDVIASSMLFSISMVAPDDGWAVGETMQEDATSSAETALMLHYDGQHWRQVAIPPHDQLNKVTMVSATEGWAVANDGNTNFPFLHYQHGVWSDVDPTQHAFYTALAMVSPHEGWAAGYLGAIGHYRNDSWVDWSTAAPGDVTALAMRSATDGWAVAASPENHTAKPYQQLTALHWDGTAWRATPLANASAAFHPIITSIAFSGSTGVLAGKIEDDGGTTQGSVLFQYANGWWNPESFQVDAALAAVSLTSPTEGWAVGYKTRVQALPNGSSGTTFDGVLLHFLNGHWTVYQP